MELSMWVLVIFLLVSFTSFPTANGNDDSKRSLGWNISVENRKRKAKQKNIIQNVFGSASKGRIHAILGPSGSGKTTLLNTLAGEMGSKKLCVDGAISTSDAFSPIYIQQEDILFSQLTTKETLETSVQLCVKERRTTESTRKLVENTMNKLGLTKVDDTRVGDAKTRGLSGGEKKRLSIGNELIDTHQGSHIRKHASRGSHSRYVFADEPTSGLDCFQAQKVIALLKLIALGGGSGEASDDSGADDVTTSAEENTVVFSIHQPRASIFALFDDVTLISEGKVIYTGEASGMVDYFKYIGYPLPKGSTPSEYYVDLVSVDYSSQEDELDSKVRIQSLAYTFAQHALGKHEQSMKAICSNADRQAALLAAKNQKKPNSSDDPEDETDVKSATPMLLKPVKALWSTTNALIALPMQVASFGITSFVVKPTTLFARGTLRCVRGTGLAIQEFRILNRRAWRQVLRDKPLNFARFMSSMFSALLFGAIYYKLGTDVSTIPDRLGLLQVAAVNTAMTSLIKATTSFVTEKNIVLKERKRGAYSVIPYFFAKMAAEIPLSSLFPCLSGVIMYKLCGLNPAEGKLAKFVAILVVESIASTALGMSIGSLVPTVESGIAIAPAAMVIFIVFGGLYVVNAPAYLSWVPKASLIRWAYEGLCINEFSDLELTGGDANGAPRGKRGNKGKATASEGTRVLERMGMGGGTIEQTLQYQAAIIAVNYLFTIAMLVRQRPQGGGYTNAHMHGTNSSCKKPKKRFSRRKPKGSGGYRINFMRVQQPPSIVTSSSSTSTSRNLLVTPKIAVGTSRAYWQKHTSKAYPLATVNASALSSPESAAAAEESDRHCSHACDVDSDAENEQAVADLDGAIDFLESYFNLCDSEGASNCFSVEEMSDEDVEETDAHLSRSNEFLWIRAPATPPLTAAATMRGNKCHQIISSGFEDSSCEDGADDEVDVVGSEVLLNASATTESPEVSPAASSQRRVSAQVAHSNSQAKTPSSGTGLKCTRMPLVATRLHPLNRPIFF